MSAARSLNDVAQDLTENGASKISKGHLGIKNQLIMASNGSLGSTGRTATDLLTFINCANAFTSYLQSCK